MVLRAATAVMMLLCMTALVAAETLEEGFEDAAALEDWTTDTRTWTVEEGVLRQPEAGLHKARAFVPQAFSDVTVAVRFLIHPAGNGVKAPGIIYRAIDETTYYYIHFDSKNRQVVWVRSTLENEWTEARRHRPIEISEEEWHTARVEVAGDEHRVYMDGELLFTEQDGTLQAGVVGLRTGQGDIAFDDLRVEGEPAELEGEFTVTRVPWTAVCTDAGAGAYEAFPDVCLTEDGELLCVFYAGYGHVAFPNDDLPRGGRVCMVRSTDYGRSWSEPEIVVDTPIDDRDPSIAQLRDGDLVVSYMSYVKERRPTHEVFLVRSSDDGETWSEPQRIELPFGGAQAVSEPVTELEDGTLLLPIYGTRLEGERKHPCGVARSTDGGDTWEVTVIEQPGPEPLYEPSIEPLPDGRIYMLIRPTMHWSQSTDGGVSWAEPQKLGIQGEAPYLLLTSEGVLLTGFRHRPTRSTSIAWSTDLGETWEGPKLIDRVIGGYPSFAELPDGRVLMVYYTEGSGSDIRQVYLDVSQEGVGVLAPKD